MPDDKLNVIEPDSISPDPSPSNPPLNSPLVATDAPKPKASWIWIKDTNGTPSVSITFVTVAFWITTLNYILSMVTKIGPLEFRAFDVAACGAYLVPLLTLYFGRRYVDTQAGIRKG